MVKEILFMVPGGMAVENPIEDAGFMAQMGAERIGGGDNEYELTNAETGTKFTFAWSPKVCLFSFY